jgi:hypothetical protein
LFVVTCPVSSPENKLQSCTVIFVKLTGGCIGVCDHLCPDLKNCQNEGCLIWRAPAKNDTCRPYV